MKGFASAWALAAVFWSAPAIAQTDGADQFERLIEQLGAPAWDLRDAAEKRLCDAPPETVGPICRRHWEHPDPEIRLRIRRICDRIGWLDPAEAERQVRAARDGLLAADPGTRARAADVIARLGHCAFALVRDLATKDADWRVRRALAELLPRIRAHDVLDVLIAQLDDADDFVKSGAGRALRDLTRQDLASWRIDDWKAWWAKARETWRVPVVVPPPPPPPPPPPVVLPPRPPVQPKLPGW